MKKILAILAATGWISVSEFTRNQVLFNLYWTAHYKGLGLTFPSAPINGVMWGLWSFIFAIAIFIISRRFSLIEGGLLAWLMAFVMMWVAIGNLGVLPLGLLWYAVPLSLIESFVAIWIIRKLSAPEPIDH